jgi:hypothetical protein
VSDSGGNDQGQRDDDPGVPVHVWSIDSSSNPTYQGMKSVELREGKRVRRTAHLSRYGTDRDNPKTTRLELRKLKVTPDNEDDEVESSFSIENEEITILRDFLDGEFPEDGFYLRLDSPRIAREIAKYAPGKLAEILKAISDKTELIKVIEDSGHADFLAAHVTRQQNLKVLDELERIAIRTDAVELDFQRIVQENAWMFGGRFVEVLAKRQLTTGDQLDVPLVTGDGSVHIVELKRAYIPRLFLEHRSHFIVGPDVHEAVAQTQNYIRSVDEEAHTIKSKFKFEAHRVFGTVVIGHLDHNKQEIDEESAYRALRTYNSHLSRVQVITYDQLIANARNSFNLF